MSNRLDTDRQAELEPKRMAECKATLEKMGYAVTEANETCLTFEHRGHIISLFPYSGWFSGKGVGSDRGFRKLIKKLKQTNHG